MAKYTILVLALLMLLGASCAKPSTPANSNLATNNQINENENADLVRLAAARDDTRLSDLRALQVSLQFYASDHDGHFPATLSDLVPTYAAAVPVDPLTKSPYVYTLQGTNSAFYSLRYTLEVSNGTIAAGDHTMTPNGLAMP